MENRRQTCGTKTSFFLHPAFFAAGRKASAEFCMARQLPACVGTCPLAVPRPAMQRYSWVLSPFQIPAEKRLAALRQAGRFSFPQAGEKSFPEPPSQRPAGRIAPPCWPSMPSCLSPSNPEPDTGPPQTGPVWQCRRTGRAYMPAFCIRRSVMVVDRYGQPCFPL